ncbi:MAG TPA: hypothetical protein VEG38_15515 [Acidimicrobiia bacterium]|nr:hypothetical protein [Acidimicrobiia bacterium]
MTQGRSRWGWLRRPVPPAAVLAVAAALLLPAVIPLVVRNACGEPVLRSAVRDKSHYHHVDDPQDPRSARSILYRGCITKARNRIFLSAVEMTPVVVATIWFLYIRPRDG